MKQKEKKKAKKAKAPSAGVKPWLVTALSLVFVILVGLGCWLQMGKYEQGVLDVYATQQDGYVQLVLDQIRITDGRGGSEQEIIDILSTLDASSGRHWTLSRESDLIFVKDVMETNTYYGYTTATYYDGTVSAGEFLDSIRENRVSHSTIQRGSQSYIASGVAFRFQGTTYRMCLLTNVYTILDHNAYLTAKINLFTLAAIALCAFVLCVEAMFFLSSSYRKKYLAEAEDNKTLRKQTEKLNQALHKEDLYDARRTAYTQRALPMIWEKLEGKDAWPLTFLILRCRGQEEQRQFMQFTQFQMNSKILRVFLDDEHILLILLRIEELELGAVLENIRIPGVLLTGEVTLTQAPDEPLDEYFDSFMERTLEDEKQTPMQI